MWPSCPWGSWGPCAHGADGPIEPIGPIRPIEPPGLGCLMEWNGLERNHGVEWSGVEFSGVKLFQIVLASPADNSLIVATNIDFTLRRFSEIVFSWLQNYQQDELHLQFFKISPKEIVYVFAKCW